MKQTLILLFIVLNCVSCQPPTSIKAKSTGDKTCITCTNNYCAGIYTGPEFIEGSDIAHQFSNEMSELVGDKLKELYRNGKFSKVDFSKIEMSTVGMGTGKVVFNLYVPFERVSDKCQAYTSFDHSGGWNHTPALDQRISQLRSVLLKGEKLEISELKTTKEGLQEYWIQWKNKELQAECETRIN